MLIITHKALIQALNGSVRNLVMLKKAIIRGIIPFLIMTGISLIMTHQGIDRFQVKSTFIVGIIMASIGATSVIYDIGGWSLMKQSLVHFLVMLVTVFPCLLASGWFRLNHAIDYFKVFGIFLLVGAVIWTILYFVFTRLLSN